MSLKTKIDQDIKTAMLAREQGKLLALRAIKSLILLEATKDANASELSQDQEYKLLNKAAKQRKEAAEVFATQNRDDLAEKELFELAIIEQYLPAKMSAEDLEAQIQEIINRLAAVSLSDLGKVMGVASKELGGQADGKEISIMVKKLLTK